MDSNTDYDAIYVKQQDAEDHYFDAEEPGNDDSPTLLKDMNEMKDDEVIEEDDIEKWQ